jgi:hypothetical protein
VTGRRATPRWLRKLAERADELRQAERCSFIDDGVRCGRQAGHDPEELPHAIVLEDGRVRAFRTPPRGRGAGAAQGERGGSPP